MSYHTMTYQGGRPGMSAPPTDLPVKPAVQRLSHRVCPFRGPLQTTSLPACAASALRRANSNAPAADSNSRAAKLYDLDREGAYTASAPSSTPAPSINAGDDGGDLLDAGWGVVPVSSPGPSTPKAVAKRTKKKQKQPVQQLLQAEEEAGAGQARPIRGTRTAFVDMSSEEGLLGMTLLQEQLMVEGRVAHGSEQKAKVAAEAAAKRERLAQKAGRKRDWVDPDLLDDGEDEGEEAAVGGSGGGGGARQYMELNLEADGTAELLQFDDYGRVVSRQGPDGAEAVEGGRDTGRGGQRRGKRSVDDDDDDPLAFLSDLDDEDNERVASGGAAGSRSRTTSAAKGRGRRGAFDIDDEDDDFELDASGRPMPGRDPLADEEVEWGLDELQPASERPSLLRELGVIKPKKEKETKKGKEDGAKAGAAAADRRGQAGVAPAPFKSAAQEDADEEHFEDAGGLGVAWGGSGGASGIDMEQQEALLSRIFKPHKVKELMAHQRAAEEEMAALKKKTTGRLSREARIDSRMRILGGSVAGKQLVASQGNTTRPMMQKVRQAIFNMMQARSGGVTGLPPDSRWLDCFAGTGSVGLEALSRGCKECHFVELDPWVVRKVLSRNIANCAFQRQAVVHNMKAEDFLRRALTLPRFAGGPFDFISVCPPYLLVSYPELMDLLERSPLIHDRTIVFVEYPKQLAEEVPVTLGPLVTVRDRRYGRTYIRVFGPAGGNDYDDGEDESGASGDEGDAGDELLL